METFAMTPIMEISYRTPTIQGGVHEIVKGLGQIARAGYAQGFARIAQAGSYVYNESSGLVHSAATRVLPMVTALSAAIHNEAWQTAYAVKDAYTISRDALTVGVAKIDEIADRSLSPTAATIAKSVVRGLPAAVITTGILGASPGLVGLAGMFLIVVASHHFTGEHPTLRGIGLGAIAAGAIHCVTGLATGNIVSLAYAGAVALAGARVLRLGGLTTQQARASVDARGVSAVPSAPRDTSREAVSPKT